MGLAFILVGLLDLALSFFAKDLLSGGPRALTTFPPKPATRSLGSNVCLASGVLFLLAGIAVLAHTHFAHR